MKKSLLGVVIGLCALTWLRSAAADDSEKYLLRYQFHPGETLRWDVEHRYQVRVSVSGTTKTVETLTTSVKVWRLTKVDPDGTATFEHSVERVEMRQRENDGDEIHYNSQTDAKAPPGYEDVAQSIGVPLLVVTMDSKGKILKRERRDVKALAHTEGCMTIPLPNEAVPVGYTWSCPNDIEVPLETGGIKRVKAVQQFTLEAVKTGVATIQVSTEIITPITDPAIEAKLVQRESIGRVRFDIDAGRVIGQQMDTDKHVVGLRGDASSYHYVNRFTEQILPQEAKLAAKVAASSTY